MKIDRKYLSFTEEVVDDSGYAASGTVPVRWTVTLDGRTYSGEHVLLTRSGATLEDARIAVTEAAREQGVEIV